MINPVDRLSWQETLGHPASASHLVDTQVNTAYNKMAVLSDHVDEFKDLYDFIFRIKGWLKYYLQANYGLEDFSDIGLNNDTNGHSGSIDLIDPATGEVKTKKVWRIYIKNYDEMIKASEAGLPIPDPIVRFANIYDPLNPVYLDLEYKNGKPTFSGTFNVNDPNSYIPLWYLKNISVDRSISTTTDSHGRANKRLVVNDVINFSDGYHINVSGAADVPFMTKGSKVNISGDATGSGTVDDDGNIVVPIAVSHAASADKTTGGTVNITGYVTGSGSFDRNGNVTVDVVPNIPDTPYTYYVGKTNARDYWGKDENGAPWGSTKNHPFASLTYAINETNKHTFPGNMINIVVVDSGDYDEHYRAVCNITTDTYIHHNLGSHPRFIGGWDFSIQSGNMLSFDAIDFEIAHSTTLDPIRNGQVFMRVFSGGIIQFSGGCHMSISDDNLGMNTWPFIKIGGSNELRFIAGNGKKEPALYCELANGVTLHAPVFHFDSGEFGVMAADDNTPVVKIVSPAGTKISGSVISLGRFAATTLANTPYPGYKVYFDWDIADDSELTQVNLGKFASLTIRKNPDKGVALPGHATGDVPELANYTQLDY